MTEGTSASSGKCPCMVENSGLEGSGRAVELKAIELRHTILYFAILTSLRAIMTCEYQNSFCYFTYNKKFYFPATTGTNELAPGWFCYYVNSPLSVK